MNKHSHSIIVAIASDDGDQMPKGHFGAASQYELYEMNADSATWLRTVTNPRAKASGEPADGGHQQGHDSQHHNGGGIGRLLGNEGVQVMVSRAFGANIKRMRQRFLPVVVHCEHVKQAIALLQSQWQRVEQHWNQGAERKHLVLR